MIRVVVTVVAIGALYGSVVATERADSLEREVKECQRYTCGAHGTLARKNNNPFNIKGSKFKGQVGRDRHGHAIFMSVEYGVRAGVVTLKAYAKDGVDTIQKVVDRFCPEQNEAYITFLSHHLGVKPTAKIDIMDRMPALLQAMSKYESGAYLDSNLLVPYE